MKFEVTENKRIANSVMKMVLRSDEYCSENQKPGQFVQLQLPGFYLRRPISVCDWTDNSITLIYKIVGEGTKAMAGFSVGVEIDALPFLGNGFDVNACGEHVLLAGGGVGLPPLLGLAKCLISAGKSVQAAAGFGSSGDVILDKEFAEIGIELHIATVDDTAGKKGFVTAAMQGIDFDCACACGPEPMLKAVYDFAPVPGQFSFEERMGCGFGACMGCSCKTKYGTKRICKDGPVLNREEIIW